MPEVTSVTLRALEGEPLRHDRICEMVEATARGIAERQGIELLSLATDAVSITVTLGASRIAAVGFAAELRRLTDTWYTKKFGAKTLWGEPHRDDLRPPGDHPPPGDEDGRWLGDPDAWKRDS